MDGISCWWWTKKEREKVKTTRQTERNIQHTEVGVLLLLLLTSCQIKGKQDKGSFYPSLPPAHTHLCSSPFLTSSPAHSLHFITLWTVWLLSWLVLNKERERMSGPHIHLNDEGFESNTSWQFLGSKCLLIVPYSLLLWLWRACHHQVTVPLPGCWATRG